MGLRFQHRFDHTSKSVADPSFWRWIRGYCVSGRAPQRLTRSETPILKLRDVAMLLATSQLNLTNEDLSRGIGSRNPGATYSLAPGNVTRGLARARAAIDHFFIVEEDELATTEATTEAALESPVADETPSANLPSVGCRFCGCRASAGGICLGCGSDS